MRDRKPIPKNQSEITKGALGPALLNQGKPNVDTIFTNNRALNTTRKTDKIKDISIGLEDIDFALKYYFENIIKPTIVQDGNRMNVPIVYGSPERWKSVQADGYYRDTNGKLVLPLIMYKRNNVEKNRSLGNKIDGNNAALFQVFETRYNQRNQYDKFSILTNRIPSKQYYVSVVPDYVTVTYDCVLLTNYVEQNNKLIEAIEYASDSYWGDANRWHFRTSLDSFGVTTTINTGEDRVVSTAVSLKVNGYLIPDNINKALSDSHLHYSPSRIVFTLETSDSSELFTSNAKPKSPQTAMGASSLVDSFNVNVTNMADIGGEIASYLDTNTLQTAGTVTSNIVTFPGVTILQPPLNSGLPPTTVNNFIFFVNGVNVASNLISIAQVGSDVVATFNTTGMGYTLLPTDEVIAVGKFQ
jgi:hypothetical protein